MALRYPGRPLLNRRPYLTNARPRLSFHQYFDKRMDSIDWRSREIRRIPARKQKTCRSPAV